MVKMIYKTLVCLYCKNEIYLNKLKEYMLFFVSMMCILVSGCMQRNSMEITLGTISVSAGDYERKDTPIRYPCQLTDMIRDHTMLKKSDDLYSTDKGSRLTIPHDHYLVLVEKGGLKSKINVQWEPEASFEWEKTGSKGALVWILDGKTPKATTRTFKLVLKEGAAPSGPFTVEDKKNKHLLIKQNKRPVLRYNYGIVQETEGQTGPYDRSSYIHPVWTPTGKIITGDFSPEHIHQRGIFLAWRPVKFGEVETDFWALGDATGRVLPDHLEPIVIQGPVFTELVIHNQGMVEDKIYFKEVWVVRIYSLSTDDVWLFDMHVSQVPVDPENPHTLPKEPVSMELQKLYYGGVSFRATSDWLRQNSRDVARAISRGVEFKGMNWLPPDVFLDILTSEGKDRKEGDRTQARWIDYTGPLGNEWGGMVMFDHPSNVRYPTPLRIHPDLPYYSWAFVQNELYTIYNDKPLEFVYRALIHNGHPNMELNERFANDFVNPPQITWQPL